LSRLLDAKSVIVLYANSAISELKTRKEIPFTIPTKNT
jgi:hypothetical protein